VVCYRIGCIKRLSNNAGVHQSDADQGVDRIVELLNGRKLQRQDLTLWAEGLISCLRYDKLSKVSTECGSKTNQGAKTVCDSLRANRRQEAALDVQSRFDCLVAAQLW
jgi:hypothetical protein